jgi:hypothetical protein
MLIPAPARPRLPIRRRSLLDSCVCLSLVRASPNPFANALAVLTQSVFRLKRPALAIGLGQAVLADRERGPERRPPLDHRSAR